MYAEDLNDPADRHVVQMPDAQNLEEDQPGLQRWTTQTLYDGWHKAHRWVTDAQQGGGRLLDEDLAGWAVEASDLGAC